ncbi:hypothetical protein [Kosmotoga pacifica]|uniref:hypothetical protein n=1 Tax=Kosmotoga pacifica TaxID=1330330 RepID=UPI0012E06E19|nr:hypothetical protein [Kosmotoga pacifica]
MDFGDNVELNNYLDDLIGVSDTNLVSGKSTMESLQLIGLRNMFDLEALILASTVLNFFPK